MCAHMSKCKNDKIKERKKVKTNRKRMLEYEFTILRMFEYEFVSKH
jgi:hypothetical protein